MTLTTIKETLIAAPTADVPLSFEEQVLGHQIDVTARQSKTVTFNGCLMETLEFVIYPDGRVKEMVTGIVGASCAEVTAAIEAQLGDVMAHEKSSEFYAQPVVVTDNVSNVASNVSQASVSRW